MFEILNFKNESKDIDNLTFTDYFYRLSLLARSIYSWGGFSNVNFNKWIEKYLYYNGHCILFKDPKMGYMVAPAASLNTLNANDEPIQLEPVTTNYKYTGPELINGKNCVLIMNNDDMIPTKYSIQLYAARLTQLKRTMDVNINAQKTPVLIKCSNKQLQTMRNVYCQYSGNTPVIYADRDLADDSIKVLKTEAPFVADKLKILLHDEWNEAMTFLGVNNANMDKRERLVDDEVQANNQQVQLSSLVHLNARERAAEEIRKVFPDLKDVSVDMNKRLQRDLVKMLEGNLPGGEPDVI